ncbi:hypothetical protein SAY86_006664 [Trapa natans]|uniref:pectinesterase n=1 Tax=Trapa natans TaxID=22666 RepID=A0AAN7LDZ2_TRANT|nr:hypothetical protein SAY86_006664 [Trapa natans]
MNSLFPLLLLSLVYAIFLSNALPVVRLGFYGNSASAAVTVTVGSSPADNFTSIQKAIDSVPVGNNQWVLIQVKPGVYKEKISVGVDKPYIYLQGVSWDTTEIQWGDHGTVKDTATFTVMADNFMASGISFRNTYNGPIVQAPAMMVYGDKVSFYKCAFIGIQDTLGDMQGRHFYHTCNIEGAVDFIWGFGQSQFHSCSIRSRGALLGGPGYITAQVRQSPQDDGGFVFKYCNILGNGKTYLGRAYSIYARVLFYECSLGGNVVPQGWDPWKSKGEENDTTFCDSTCSGPGSDTSHRVAWMKKLEGPELLHLVSLRLFMDKEGWVEAQPVPPGWMGSRD